MSAGCLSYAWHSSSTCVSQPVLTIVFPANFGFVAAVAVVAGGHEITKIHRIERVQRLGQVVVISFALAVVSVQQVADTAKWAFAYFVGLHERLIEN